MYSTRKRDKNKTEQFSLDENTHNLSTIRSDQDTNLEVLIVVFAHIYLFRKLFFAQFVQSEEFSGQSHIVDKTTASKLHTNDDLTIWDHHGHCTELDLEILRELLSASVPWVHCQEDA